MCFMPCGGVCPSHWGLRASEGQLVRTALRYHPLSSSETGWSTPQAGGDRMLPALRFSLPLNEQNYPYTSLYTSALISNLPPNPNLLRPPPL